MTIPFRINLKIEPKKSTFNFTIKKIAIVDIEIIINSLTTDWSKILFNLNPTLMNNSKNKSTINMIERILYKKLKLDVFIKTLIKILIPTQRPIRFFQRFFGSRIISFANC